MEGRLVLLLATLVSVSFACKSVSRPDCKTQPAGSFHPHELNCNLFYRCDELGNARAHACPTGKSFYNLYGYICVPESYVTCDRCEVAQSRCGECSCSPTTQQPCYTTTNPPVTTSDVISTTERVTTPDPTTTTPTTPEPTTTTPTTPEPTTSTSTTPEPTTPEPTTPDPTTPDPTTTTPTTPEPTTTTPTTPEPTTPDPTTPEPTPEPTETTTYGFMTLHDSDE